MINHARTLLLNRPASYYTGLLRNAYISPDFKPVTLTTFLAGVRDAILPPTGSRQQEIDASNIVMRILHSPDLEPYVLDLDKRITYGVTEILPASLTSSRVALNTVKSQDCDVVPQYTYASTSYSTMKPLAGVYTWSVVSLDANRVKVTNTKGMTSTVTLNPNSSSTTSKSVDIIPGYISIYFDLPSMAFTGSFNVTYTLTITASYDVPVAMAAMRQAFAHGVNVFDYKAFPDIMPVLKTAWLDDPALTTRFGAGVLAYIYSLEGMRI